MSSTALKIIAIVTVILAVILGVVAFQMTRSYTRAPEPAPPVASAAGTAGEAAAQSEEERMPKAVVALERLPAFAPITAEQLRLAPVAVQPEGHFAAVEDVVNRIPLVAVEPGTPLTGRFFKDVNDLAMIIPEGHKAVSVAVDDVIAIGNFLRPGDVVDVLLYLRGGGDVPAVQARKLLAGAQVLALEERIIDTPPDAEGEEQRRRRQRTVVLAVPDEEVTRFMLGSSMGDIRLALHRQDPAALAADGVTRDGSFLIPPEGGAAEPAASGQAPPATLVRHAPGAVDDKNRLQIEQPVTSGELAAVKKPRSQQAAPRHRIYVYRGAAVETVLD